MKQPARLLFILAALATAPLAPAQTIDLYIPEGWLFNTTYTGTPQGTSVNGATTMVPGDPGTNFQIQNKVASPQGGEYIAGVYQGTQNFINYFYLGFPINDLINADGTGATLLDGQQYNAVFWMRGNEVLDLLAGGNYGFTYETNVPVEFYDSTRNNLISSYNATVNFSNNSWTEVAIPFTYDTATMTGSLLTLEFMRAASDWDYTNNTLVSQQLLNSRLGSTSFDFVQAIPEPSSSMLLVLSLGGLLAIRRRPAL